jgi:hypothetical protein
LAIEVFGGVHYQNIWGQTFGVNIWGQRNIWGQSKNSDGGLSIRLRLGPFFRATTRLPARRSTSCLNRSLPRAIPWFEAWRISLRTVHRVVPGRGCGRRLSM